MSDQGNEEKYTRDECELKIGDELHLAKLNHEAILALEHGESEGVVGSIARVIIEFDRQEPRLTDWVEIAYQMLRQGSPKAQITRSEIFEKCEYSELVGKLNPICAAIYMPKSAGKEQAASETESDSSPETDTHSESTSESESPPSE